MIKVDDPIVRVHDSNCCLYTTICTLLTIPISEICNSNYKKLTGTDLRYHTFCFDMMTNLSVTHFDTQVCLNSGLTSNNDELGGLVIRGKNDNELLESFDSNAIVKNLCASQSYHFMDMFLTFTCN